MNELEMETGVARFDLHLFMEEKDGGLKGYFDYNTDLFNADTIERLLGHFQNLLDGIVTDPDCRISDLPLLTQAEKHQLLVEWNDTKGDYPKNKCIHELFEARVERAPEVVAVVFEDQQLTYRKLNARANQLAHHLRKLGVGPEVLVTICVERSVEMIIAVLSVLKAGGAYVPLDPAYPKERLAFMLEETQAPVLLTQERLVGSLPDHSTREIYLDRDWKEIARQGEENPEREAISENLAYVLYTSGSTGNPKGVMIRHSSIVNLSMGLRQVVYAGEDARLLVSLNAPLAFDASVQQLVQLLRGHTLYIVPDELRADGPGLLDFSTRYELDVLDCTAVQLRMLLEAGLNRDSKHVPKLVLVGGDAVDGTTWSELASDNWTRYYNVYGPTECTVDATVCEVQVASTSPSIGRPITNTQVFILDPHFRPVPIGLPGELHIGGDGLARGYLNRPEWTAEKFIPHPFSAEEGARLYRTGDLARYLPDGNIEFLGRIDHQVKIRGYRIELGEIESVLGQHPAVREVVVLAREDVPGDKRLVAYIVADRESISTAHNLRNFLKQKLPEYMVPSVFLFLDSLPLIPNGKVDRMGLPAPDQSRPELEESFVAPRSPVEEILAGLWAEVLKLEQVGIHDNFFDLGGYSLKATQVMSRLRKIFEIDLPLRTLFEKPTVEGLAKAIVEKRAEGADTEEVTSILAELESMSEEEAKSVLAAEKPT